MRSETPHGTSATRSRYAIPIEPNQVREPTYRPTCNLTIPPDRDPPLNQADLSDIEPGDVVVFTIQPQLSIVATHRLARAIGHAIDLGAAAVVIHTPTPSDRLKLVCWSQSPRYRIGDILDVKV